MKFGTQPVTMEKILCDECKQPVHDAEWDSPLVVSTEFANKELDRIYIEEQVDGEVIDDRLICHRHETHWCEHTDALVLGPFENCPHPECHTLT